MEQNKIYDFFHYICGFNGIREGSPAHQKILSDYCNIKPLPRGYKPKISDAWCAIFVSVCFRNFFPDLKFPYECSAHEMWKKICGSSYAHVNGSGYKPKSGDVIFYKNSVGYINHVGIIFNATPVSMLTIEGNYSDKVTIREIYYTDRKIYGYYDAFDNINW